MTNETVLYRYIQQFNAAIKIDDRFTMRKVLSELNGYYLALHVNQASLQTLGAFCSAISTLTDRYCEHKHASNCLRKPPE